MNDHVTKLWRADQTTTEGELTHLDETACHAKFLLREDSAQIFSAAQPAHCGAGRERRLKSTLKAVAEAVQWWCTAGRQLESRVLMGKSGPLVWKNRSSLARGFR